MYAYLFYKCLHPHPIESKRKLIIHINFTTMAVRPIHIQGINPDNTLILSDNGNTTASRGDTIQWIIDNGSGVGSISSIHDTSALDIFYPDPAKQPGNSTLWQGTINPNLAIPAQESYCIYYTKPNDPTVYTQDPIIRVNS